MEYAEKDVQGFLGERVRKALFIPFAAITISYETFTQMTAERFRALGYNVTSVHEYKNPQKACMEADAIVIGGGNTFQLLKKAL